MSKHMSNIGNGFINFADPDTPNEILRFSNGRSVSRKTGLVTIRTRINQVMPGWAMVNPGCQDACASVPHDDSFTLQISNLQTTDAEGRAALRTKLEDFFADVLQAFDAGLSAGSLPSPMAEFDGKGTE